MSTPRTLHSMHVMHVMHSMRSMRRAPSVRLLLTAGLALLLGACQWGTRPAKLPAAMGPQGPRVALRLAGERTDRIGELYAVDSLGVLVRFLATDLPVGVATDSVHGTLFHVAWPRLSAMDVDKLDRTYDIVPGQRMTAERRSRLALVSRFPQGLSGALLARVLAALGQQGVREWP